MIDNTAALAIGGVIGGVAKYISYLGIRGGILGWLATLIAAAVTATYIVTHGGFHLASAWDDLAGFVNVLVATGGVFHIAENTPAAASAVSKAFSGDPKP